MIVYLASNSGGATRFFSDDGDLLASVAPKKGKAVLFLHDTLHDGEEMKDEDEAKYILKTEVMFTRINTQDIPKSLLEGYRNLESYKRMVKVYAKSEAAFDNGDVEDFVKYYKEAIEIQRNASTRPAESMR